MLSSMQEPKFWCLTVRMEFISPSIGAKIAFGSVQTMDLLVFLHMKIRAKKRKNKSQEKPKMIHTSTKNIPKSTTVACVALARLIRLLSFSQFLVSGFQDYLLSHNLL